MKILSTLRIWVLLPFMLILASCNDDEKTRSAPIERYLVSMFVTNDTNEDLIRNSKDYFRTGYTGYVIREEFRFDTWNVYLDNSLIQTEGENRSNCLRIVNSGNISDTESKYISLGTNGEIQKRKKDWQETHVVEYAVTSASLFNDTEEHIIRMEFTSVNEYNTRIKYSISVDGIKQDVYYPVGWDDMQPKSQDEVMNVPYFVLNVDEL